MDQRSHTQTQTSRPNDLLPHKLPHLALSYGQVMWLLLRLGYGSGVSESTFHEYLKSLRKLGIPFGRTVSSSKRKTRAQFSYCHVMELALVLSLRIYHVVPDSVLHVVSRHRQQLHRFYRKAYAQRASGKGRTVTCTIAHSKSFEIRGLFLDLGIKFSGGQLIKFGPPKLLSPAQTVIHFLSTAQSGQFFLPINLSSLSERVLALALSPSRKRRRSPPGKIRFPDAPSISTQMS